VDGSAWPASFAGEERRVDCAQRRGAVDAGKASFDHGKFMAVFKAGDHYQAIKSCTTVP
jgi:hypothetical protein